MQRLLIKGGRVLSGNISISGSRMLLYPYWLGVYLQKSYVKKYPFSKRYFNNGSITEFCWP